MTTEYNNLEQLTIEAKKVIKFFTHSNDLSKDEELIAVVIEQLVNSKNSWNPKLSQFNTYKLNICKNAIYNFIKTRKTNKAQILSNAIPISPFKLNDGYDKKHQIGTDEDNLHSKKSKCNVEMFTQFKEVLAYVHTQSWEEEFLFTKYYLDGMIYSEIAEILGTSPDCQMLRMRNLLRKIKTKFKDGPEGLKTAI